MRRNSLITPKYLFPTLFVRYARTQTMAAQAGEDRRETTKTAPNDRGGLGGRSSDTAAAPTSARFKPIVARRASDILGGTRDGKNTEEEEDGEALSWSPPPLFELRFDKNPQDPEYDAKIQLAVDQVRTRAASGAGGLKDGQKWRTAHVRTCLSSAHHFCDQYGLEVSQSARTCTCKVGPCSCPLCHSVPAAMATPSGMLARVTLVHLPIRPRVGPDAPSQWCSEQHRRCQSTSS